LFSPLFDSKSAVSFTEGLIGDVASSIWHDALDFKA